MQPGFVFLGVEKQWQTIVNMPRTQGFRKTWGELRTVWATVDLSVTFLRVLN